MFLRCLAFCLLLPFACLAQDLPQPQSDTVSDLADLLPPEVEARVVAALQQGRAETGVQVVLVTMNSIADHGGAGARIEDYAKLLFNTWGIGDASRNDGVLILVARDDHAMRIALGRAYDSVWDNAAQLVIDRDFLPAFRDDRYADGIEKGVGGVFETLIKPHQAGQPVPEPADQGMTGAEIAMFVAVVVGMLGAIASGFIGQFSESIPFLNKCPNCGKRGSTTRTRVITPPTLSRNGRAERFLECPHCLNSTRTEYDISTKSQSSGNNSGGGFGGGSSSGGGATGRW